MVRGTGLEPVTPTVSRWCSTTELTALAVACGREDKLKFVVVAMFFFNFFELSNCDVFRGVTESVGQKNNPLRFTLRTPRLCVSFVSEHRAF